ncbi:type I secretion system permease/ATPase [Aphanothece hegewaldii CCALA 016]|uniref:Type I secretion system permease/ATPase n=1 Tax=Aphanothece hegewaldii CCALA 016 TaxID=2107694 RepID=A0A2T1M248_9CHRO|nr:peptidase domain-containing ABC transporter [Aphanothece hegewaldii]PSF38789.1 type I secretion system permease/ATPase [Aphanothece hegewaldii CCALA 016]
MSYTTVNYRDFLLQIAPFDQLPSEELTNLSQKMQPWRFSMGRVISMRGQESSHVVILYEGQARLLGYDPRNQMPVTLELLRSGDVFGWINQIRGTTCETVIASTDTVCLMLKQEEFAALIAKYPNFKAYYQQKISQIEVFDILGTYFNEQALGVGNLKQITQNLLNDTQIYYLPPGITTVADHPTLQNRQKRWFVSSGNLENVPLGRSLEITHTQQTLSVADSNPVRLIGLSEIQLSEQLTVQPTVIDQTEAGDPYIDINLSDSLESEIPDAPPDLLKPVPKTQPSNKGKTSYPFVAGKTPIDAGMACFQMLCQHFNMPFRRDVLRRIIADQLQKHGSLSLPLCGAIGELMGLNTQLISIKSSSLTYLNAPALVKWQDSLAILYEISSQKLVIAVPESGLMQRKPEEFIDTWGDEGEVLLLQPTKETPQSRFGLSWFIPSVNRFKGVLAIVFIASFFVQLFALANPLMIQVIIDQVITKNSPDTLHVLGIFLLVVAIFEGILTFLRTSLFVDTTNRIDMALGSEIIDHLLRLPLRYFEKRPVGEISTRVNELENIRQFLTGTALTVVLDAIFSVIYVVVMVIYSPILTLWALGVIPVLIALTAIFAPIIRHQLRAKAERNAETQSYLVEVMTGIQTVKAQNIELQSRWQWQERYAKYVSTGFNTVLTSTMAGALSNFFNKVSGLLVLWVGAYLVLKQELTLGQLIAFRIIAGYVTSPILRLTQIWQNFQETALSLERLADIVDTPQEAENDRQNIPMPMISGAVKYDNISFRFKPHGPLNLHNVNLDFPAGTFVALVGQSGAGKSTLAKLLSRLYEPEGGRILIDGYDIGKVELYSLRRQVGVVPQEPLLFDGTIQENIALTNPDATSEEIIEAAKVAVAHEFIMSLSNGYNTRVGERGASLSGGQRQRIAIARTVLQRPEILVLDEATSALDYMTEQQVCINLNSAFKGRSVFFITHRLATIKTADVIVMMDSGTVVEQGTHEELMKLKGRYYYLYHQQESRL